MLLQKCKKLGKNLIFKSYFMPDVEIMVYLGILDTRIYLGSQKILTEIIAILWREWFCEINIGSLLWKQLQWITVPIICSNKQLFSPQFFSVNSSLSKDSQWTMTISCVATIAFLQKISEPYPRIPESPKLFPGLLV